MFLAIHTDRQSIIFFTADCDTSSCYLDVMIISANIPLKIDKLKESIVKSDKSGKNKE